MLEFLLQYMYTSIIYIISVSIFCKHIICKPTIRISPLAILTQHCLFWLVASFWELKQRSFQLIDMRSWDAEQWMWLSICSAHTLKLGTASINVTWCHSSVRSCKAWDFVMVNLDMCIFLGDLCAQGEDSSCLGQAPMHGHTLTNESIKPSLHKQSWKSGKPFPLPSYAKYLGIVNDSQTEGPEFYISSSLTSNEIKNSSCPSSNPLAHQHTSSLHSNWDGSIPNERTDFLWPHHVSFPTSSSVATKAVYKHRAVLYWSAQTFIIPLGYAT